MHTCVNDTDWGLHDAKGDVETIKSVAEIGYTSGGNAKR